MNRALGAMAFAALLATGCASRGTVHRVQDDIQRLRLELADTRSAQESAARDLERAQAELRALDTRTRELGAGLRGTADGLASLAERVAAADEAIRQTRAQLAAPPMPAAAAPPAAPVERRAAPREAREPRAGGPEQVYAAALTTFRAREYGQAVLDFLDFIGKHPRHPLAANAQYWIGEAYYVQRDYRQALLEFQKVLEMGSGKLGDALVKVGLCHWSLRAPGHARAAWQKVVHEHPGTEAAGIAQSLLRKHATARR